MERFWAKFVNGNQQKVPKKATQEKQKFVVAKEDNKKMAASAPASAEEKKPLLEQKDDEEDDDDSDHDVYEDALSGTEQEEQGEKQELFLNVLGKSEEVQNNALEKGLVAAAAPLVQIRCGAIWSALAHSAELPVGEDLNVLTLRILREPMQLSSRTTLLLLGQHALLVTAYYQLVDTKRVPVPFTTHLAISVSYTDHVMYPTCVNNGLVTAAAATLPRARNVFCIKPANPIGAMPHVRYGQPIILQLIASATPIYLAAGPQTASDKSCAVRLTTALNESCYFQFVNCLPGKGDNMDNYPVATHAAFLVQHVESNLFLTLDSRKWLPTTFGLENVVKLQPVELIDKRVASKHFFKAFLN